MRCGHKDGETPLHVAMPSIPRSPELSRTPKDARPRTIEELEDSFVHSEETVDGREGRACLRIMDTKEVRDEGRAKREDELPLAAADQNIVSVLNGLTAITLLSHLHHRVTVPQPEHSWIPCLTARDCSPQREALETILHISPPYQKLVGRTDMVDLPKRLGELMATEDG